MNLSRLVFSALVLGSFSVSASALSFVMDFDNIPVAVGPPTPPNQVFGSLL